MKYTLKRVLKKERFLKEERKIDPTFFDLLPGSYVEGSFFGLSWRCSNT
jgi:hypothetical protein